VCVAKVMDSDHRKAGSLRPMLEHASEEVGDRELSLADIKGPRRKAQMQAEIDERLFKLGRIEHELETRFFNAAGLQGLKSDAEAKGRQAASAERVKIQDKIQQLTRDLGNPQTAESRNEILYAIQRLNLQISDPASLARHIAEAEQVQTEQVADLLRGRTRRP
jgi:hypothetical protein